MNHYVPLWKAEQVDAGKYEKLMADTENEIQSLETVLKIHASKKGPLHNSLRESTSERLQMVHNWKDLQEWLWNGGGFVPGEVPADGNCAIWSLLSLQKDNPQLVASEHVEECQKIRSEIADLWPQVCEDQMWQFLFHRLLQQIPVPEEQRTADSAPKVKKEPVATPKTKGRKRKPVSVDLTSPLPKEGEQKMSKKAVEVVGSQRPACELKKLDTPFDFPPMPGEKDSEEEGLKKKLENVADLDGSPKKTTRSKKGRKRKEQDEAEKPEETVKPGRKRTCKKKEKSDLEMQKDVVHTYLSSLGITWWSHQRFHGSSHANGADKCKEFASFPTLFLEGKMPQCVTCLQNLNEKGFDLEELKTCLQEAQEDSTLSAGMKRWIDLQRELGVEDTEIEKGPELSSCTDIVLYVPPPPAEEQQIVPAQVPSDDPRDIEAIFRRNPFLQLLPENSHDKKVPIRCLACKSKSQPLGKVFEALNLRSKRTIQNFVTQHCTRPRHLENLAEWVKQQKQGKGKDMKPEKKQSQTSTVQCQGLSLTNGEERFKHFRFELLQWARLIKLSTVFGKHKYVFNINTEELTLFHEDCQKVIRVPQDQEGDMSQHLCAKCNDWKLGNTATQSAIRFSIKYWAVKLLQARLFKSEEVVNSIIEDMKSRSLYKIHPSKVDEVVGWNLADLQKNLRSSWLKMRKDTFTPQLNDFLEEAVRCSVLLFIE